MLYSEGSIRARALNLVTQQLFCSSAGLIKRESAYAWTATGWRVYCDITIVSS